MFHTTNSFQLLYFTPPSKTTVEIFDQYLFKYCLNIGISDFYSLVFCWRYPLSGQSNAFLETAWERSLVRKGNSLSCSMHSPRCTIASRSYCHYLKISNWGLPWWRSGWESACQCRGHGFEPWSGKISHAMEQLGPWATTTEPACLEPVLHNKRGRDSERPTHRDEEWPPLSVTRESPRTETKAQHSQK